MAAAVYAFGTIFFLLFSSGERQPWAQFEGYNALMNENEDNANEDYVELSEKEAMKKEDDIVNTETKEEKDSKEDREEKENSESTEMKGL